MTADIGISAEISAADHFNASAERPSVVLRYISVVLVGVAGYAIAAIKPLMVTSYVANFGLSTRLAGYLLGTEMTSMAVGTLAAAVLLPYTRGRRYVLLALLTILVGDLGSMTAGVGTALIIWRVIAGLGHGFALGRLAAAIAMFEHPDRVSGLYTVCLTAFASAFSFLLPHLQAAMGPRGLFMIGAVTAPLALVGLRWFPVRPAPSNPRDAGPSVQSSRLPVATILLVVIGTCFYYVSIGAYWPYVGQFSHATHLDYAATTRILGWANLWSICGSSISIVVSDRFGRFWLIAVLFCVQLFAVIGVLLAGGGIFVYAASASLYIFAWLGLFPYLMGLMSRLDPVGRLNGLLYAIAGTAFAVGPAAAGWLIGHSPTEKVGLVRVQEIALVLLFVGGGVLVVLAARHHYRTAGRGLAASSVRDSTI